MHTTTGILILVGGIIVAGLISIVVSRWTLKYDRRARRKQQEEIRRRRIGGIDNG